ncbi:hypothetical protein BofuT4_P053780.1 [Botrytis cinerea T4]|uniref:Uncharacterized protein n=1 Tax=Botryotinia fuckeliana (strain T4) TaxID=999810 RepID=G2XVF7_BOTF4|nr:hypothetical protein BofuT4_P053780.1 [Botrytis cinerea T4]
MAADVRLPYRSLASKHFPHSHPPPTTYAYATYRSTFLSPSLVHTSLLARLGDVQKLSPGPEHPRSKTKYCHWFTRGCAPPFPRACYLAESGYAVFPNRLFRVIAGTIIPIALSILGQWASLQSSRPLKSISGPRK